MSFKGGGFAGIVSWKNHMESMTLDNLASPYLYFINEYN